MEQRKQQAFPGAAGVVRLILWAAVPKLDGTFAPAGAAGNAYARGGKWEAVGWALIYSREYLHTSLRYMGWGFHLGVCLVPDFGTHGALFPVLATRETMLANQFDNPIYRENLG